MRNRFLQVSFFLAVSILFYSCATITAPTGGISDTTAPILKGRTIKDSMLNFKGGKFEFDFDEFIQAKDIQNKLVMTPLVKTKPTVSVHKRKVTIDIRDSILEPNTTYNVSLGNAIGDLHENNLYDNFNFTFSTGNYFDSLKLQGKVIDAETGKLDTSAIALLYLANANDSAIYKTKPMYVQKVNGGEFYFKNLPAKNFKLYALKDMNNNLLYDALGEKIAFTNSIVNPKDSTAPYLLYTFLEKNNVDTSAKKVKGLLTRDNTTVVSNSPFAYTINIDTTAITKRSFSFLDTIKIAFTKPIASFDKTKIRLYQGEILDESAFVEYDSNLHIIKIKPEWLQDASYKLHFQKGFAKDSVQTKLNEATFLFKTKRLSDYGNLIIKQLNEKNSIIELLQNGKVIAQKQVTDSVTQFNTLTPNTYQIRILHDDNGNGKWDTGSLKEKIQPEKMDLIPQDISIKANWDNKLDLRLKPKSRLGNK